MIFFAAIFLQSTQPISAARHFFSISAVSDFVKYLCRAKMVQTSGWPGSRRNRRAGSVTAFIIRLAVSSSEWAISITPSSSDLLILPLPVIDGINGNSVSLAFGSGKVSPKALLNLRAISLASSRCGSWSSPTGMTSALYKTMSDVIRTG